MATWRARGGRPLTTLPPISTSPAVASSSPAIVRSSVVLPQPEGPSRTRYSPSPVPRSTPSTAATSPWRKCFLSPRTSTASAIRGAVPSRLSAADQTPLAPFLEDRHDLALGGGDGGFRRLPAARRARHHVRQEESAEHLADRRVGRALVADVRAPVERVLEHGQLVGRLGAERVVVEPALQVRHALRERREVVQLRFPGGARVVLRVVQEE